MVFNWTQNGSGSAIIEAVAGAGKTTTLVEMLKLTKGAVAFMAYNKKIADEIKAKVAPLGFENRVRVGTVHSFGFSALRDVYKSTKVEGKKLQKLCVTMRMPSDITPFAMALVSLAKQAGIGAISDMNSKQEWMRLVDHHNLLTTLPDDGSISVDDGINSAYALLEKSNETTSEMIDFDDMVYVPVLQNLRVWQNNWVLLDEAQDTNATRRALAKMLLMPTGRLVAVGDPHQAIYGFTGADNNSLDLIRQDFNAITLPLTVTYRCPQAVVSEARKWVSHITAHETAPQGEVKIIERDDFWEFHSSTLTADDAILCRNTRPLISLAYALIRRGIGCMVEGREIGMGLLALSKKWKKARTIKALRERLDSWADKEIARALAKDEDSRAAAIADQIGALKEIMSQISDDESVDRVQESIFKLFGDTPAGERPKVVTLSTIHKSKGREWKRVIWWGKNIYQPSKWAKQVWEQKQENNLMYVAATRAQNILIHVSLPKESA